MSEILNEIQQQIMKKYSQTATYEAIGDDLTEEEMKYNGESCTIIEQTSSYEYIVKFEDGHTMPVYDDELIK